MNRAGEVCLYRRSPTKRGKTLLCQQCRSPLSPQYRRLQQLSPLSEDGTDNELEQIENHSLQREGPNKLEFIESCEFESRKGGKALQAELKRVVKEAGFSCSVSDYLKPDKIMILCIENVKNQPSVVGFAVTEHIPSENQKKVVLPFQALFVSKMAKVTEGVSETLQSKILIKQIKEIKDKKINARITGKYSSPNPIILGIHPQGFETYPKIKKIMDAINRKFEDMQQSENFVNSEGFRDLKQSGVLQIKRKETYDKLLHQFVGELAPQTQVEDLLFLEKIADSILNFKFLGGETKMGEIERAYKDCLKKNENWDEFKIKIKEIQVKFDQKITCDALMVSPCGILKKYSEDSKKRIEIDSEDDPPNEQSPLVNPSSPIIFKSSCSEKAIYPFPLDKREGVLEEFFLEIDKVFSRFNKSGYCGSKPRNRQDLMASLGLDSEAAFYTTLKDIDWNRVEKKVKESKAVAPWIRRLGMSNVESLLNYRRILCRCFKQKKGRRAEASQDKQAVMGQPFASNIERVNPTIACYNKLLGKNKLPTVMTADGTVMAVVEQSNGEKSYVWNQIIDQNSKISRMTFLIPSETNSLGLWISFRVQNQKPVNGSFEECVFDTSAADIGSVALLKQEAPNFIPSLREFAQIDEDVIFIKNDQSLDPIPKLPESTEESKEIERFFRSLPSHGCYFDKEVQLTQNLLTNMAEEKREKGLRKLNAAIKKKEKSYEVMEELKPLLKTFYQNGFEHQYFEEEGPIQGIIQWYTSETAFCNAFSEPNFLCFQQECLRYLKKLRGEN